MTLAGILCFALLPSVMVFLIGLCIVHHGRRWEAMTEEEKEKDYEGSII
jgi:hypothetical protein